MARNTFSLKLLTENSVVICTPISQSKLTLHYYCMDKNNMHLAQNIFWGVSLKNAFKVLGF